jgi:hypothetical protein
MLTMSEGLSVRNCSVHSATKNFSIKCQKLKCSRAVSYRTFNQLSSKHELLYGHDDGLEELLDCLENEGDLRWFPSSSSEIYYCCRQLWCRQDVDHFLGSIFNFTSEQLRMFVSTKMSYRPILTTCNYICGYELPTDSDNWSALPSDSRVSSWK